MQFIKNGPDIPNRLLAAHEDGNVIFFCGAGISYPAGLPGFGDLVAKIFSGLGESPNPVEAAAIKARQYDIAVGQLERRLIDGRAIVREQLAKVLTPNLAIKDATATHEALLTLAKDRKDRYRLITTNFDRLFEDVIASKLLNLTRCEAPLLPIPKKHLDGLVYLHGLLPATPKPSDLERLVVSSGDFGLAYLNERWASRFVGELFRNFTVCFVGYSIDDPVLRYMMDALAADQLRGESPPEMFAFGGYSKNGKQERREETQSNQWKAKNVTPILYADTRKHRYLHETLRSWAKTYRSGATGKIRIVHQYAAFQPLASTLQDDFAGRMLWALGDKSVLPAKIFADFDPRPPFVWLEKLIETSFDHSDLSRFGVTPETQIDKSLRFSFLDRPAPYRLAPRMKLFNSSYYGNGWDSVMQQMARWLARYVGDPELVLWVAKNGGQIQPEFAQCIEHALTENSLPPYMQALWHVVLAGRLKSRDVSGGDVHSWNLRLKREGLTVILRMQLRDLLAPQVQLTAVFEGWGGEVEEEGELKEPTRLRDLVNWEVVLSDDHLHSDFSDLAQTLHWQAALPDLLADASSLLRDALDLMRELGGAGDRHDSSYIAHASIGDHAQNRNFHSWTALIVLVRDAWLATVNTDPDRARRTAEDWFSVPYPLFRRLVFFAAAQDNVISTVQAFDWLLSDEGWWLWSVETQRETLRLLAALAPRLDKAGLATLEQAILLGPPRELFRFDMQEEHWKQSHDREIWLLLAKANAAGAQFGTEATTRLQALAQQYPEWQLTADDRDEFPMWMGDGGEWRTFVPTPKKYRDLLDFLKKTAAPEYGHDDDWRLRCSEDFRRTASALVRLSRTGIWPIRRWREAMQAWAEDELQQRSWRCMASVLSDAPDGVIKELKHSISWWLQSIVKTFDGSEAAFLNLLRRVLSLEAVDGVVADGDLIFQAINHPIGQVTDAALQWWYRRELEDKQGLPVEIKPLLTQLCDTEIVSFRLGRLVLATHVITLFRLDPDWATKYLLPLFDWKVSILEAKAAWAGYLRAARLYRPLMVAIKQPFLATSAHYMELGETHEQYASLLTYAALEFNDIFSNKELATATQSLPTEGLASAATALVRALQGAGDQANAYFLNRLQPYFKFVWPKSRDVMTLAISEKLARLCVQSGDAFPDAFKSLKRFLQAIEYPNVIVSRLFENRLCERFPDAALEFLAIVVQDFAHRPPSGLSACLDAISTTNPTLEENPAMESLRNYLRLRE